MAIGLGVSILSWGVTDIAAKSRYANIGNFIATDPFLNLGLGVLFIFFALWMFIAVSHFNAQSTDIRHGRHEAQLYKSTKMLRHPPREPQPAPTSRISTERVWARN